MVSTARLHSSAFLTHRRTSAAQLLAHDSPPDSSRICVVSAHQFARMSPTMYLHWLFARRIETASFSDFLVRRSKVGRALEIRFSVPATSNPKQARQFHSRSRERNRVERIRNIYERACFLPFRSLRQQGESQARPPGRRGAAQFHERPARKTATENRIEFHDTARLEFNLDALLKSFEPTSNESCFESSLFQKGCANGPSLMFAFYSPRLF